MHFALINTKTKNGCCCHVDWQRNVRGHICYAGLSFCKTEQLESLWTSSSLASQKHFRHTCLPGSCCAFDASSETSATRLSKAAVACWEVERIRFRLSVVWLRQRSHDLFWLLFAIFFFFFFFFFFFALRGSSLTWESNNTLFLQRVIASTP